MGGTKFVVLQLKQLVRTGIFVIIGIAIVVALILALSSKEGKTEAGIYNPGTYSAQIILHSKPVNVLVTVDEYQIESILLSEMEDVQEVFYPLFRPTLDELAQEIIRKQTTNISIPNDAEYTSRILLDAVNSALMKAIANTETQY